MKIPEILTPICIGLVSTGIFGLAESLFAADRPAILEKPQLQSMTVVPLYGDDGKLQSLSVTAKYLVTAIQPDGRTKQKTIVSVDADLKAQASQQAVVGNEIVLLGELGDDVLTLSEALWVQRFPPPLPVLRRRALRESAVMGQP